MKYLTVSADYQSTGINDIDGNPIGKDDLKLSENLWRNIESWINSYAPIIPMDEATRIANRSLIRSLDNEGISLCQKIKIELSNNVKIEYFSEGMLKRIPFK